MNNKKSRLFLRISLAVFALTLILFFVKMAVGYSEFKTTSSTLSPNDLVHFEYAFVIELFAYLFFGTPALLLEICGIRSVYRILKHQPRGSAKICWLISAILSFSAFVFQALMFTGVLDFTKDSGSVRLQEIVLLLTGLPVAIASFVLGYTPAKQKGEIK